MQFLKTLSVLLFTTLISAAAFPQGADTAVDASFTGVSTQQSADGKQYTFSIYENGKLEGTIVFTDDPAQLAINAFDASGAKLDGAAWDAAGGDASRSALACNKACMIWNFIRKYGARAAKFIACLGNKIPAPCWLNILSCMVSADPWSCFESILCSAGPIKACVRG